MKLVWLLSVPVIALVAVFAVRSSPKFAGPAYVPNVPPGMISGYFTGETSQIEGPASPALQADNAGINPFDTQKPNQNLAVSSMAFVIAALAILTNRLLRMWNKLFKVSTILLGFVCFAELTFGESQKFSPVPLWMAVTVMGIFGGLLFWLIWRICEKRPVPAG